jgi:hypothetical protein
MRAAARHGHVPRTPLSPWTVPTDWIIDDRARGRYASFEFASI